MSRPLRAWLRCGAGCAGEFPIWTAIYRCPSCGDLLDVAHDVDALTQTPAHEWRRRFETRTALAAGRRSGVWAHREWICPEIEDASIVSLNEGGTSLLRLDRYGRDLGLRNLWIKLCGDSHTGSFKDLGMTVLLSVVRQMQARGTDVRAVACASTGDTSAALAAYAAAAGVPAIVILPRAKVSPAQLVQPMASGALVLSVDTDFDGCMAIVQRLADDAGVYLANSMNSLRLEGQKTLSIELVQQLGWRVPDVVILPGGNLGNVSAIGAGFDLMIATGLIDRRPRLVVAQAAAANPLYRAYRRGWHYEPVTAGPTLATAIQIGHPVSIRRAIRTLTRFDGIVEEASEVELMDASARCDRTGFFVCPQTGVALAALEQLARRGDIDADATVVVISTANGLKFAESKLAYHQQRAAGAGGFANPLIEVENDYAAVRSEIERRIST